MESGIQFFEAMKQTTQDLEYENASLRLALILIAASPDDDGKYFRDRKACAELAQLALRSSKSSVLQ